MLPATSPRHPRGLATIVIAAERTGHRVRGIERDPLCVDTAVRRWQKHTGKSATLAVTGQSFAETERERVGNGSDSDSAPSAEAA